MFSRGVSMSAELVPEPGRRFPCCYRRSVRVLQSVAVATLATSVALAQAGREDGPCEAARAPMPAVIGWAENVRLTALGIEQSARMDTGASLGAIDATIMKIIGSDAPGTPERVVFSIADSNGGTVVVQRDIVDWSRIKNKGAAGTTLRPVVMMEICLAGKTITDRMTLAERRAFSYPILVGRNFLRAGQFVVDSDARYTHAPECRGSAEF
jgi:hypothetical protein